MDSWMGEAFEKIIAGVAITSILVLILVLFISPSKLTGVPEVYQQFIGALSR